MRSIPLLARTVAGAVRVLIVDDEEDMRDLVRMTLELADGIDVVGEAIDAEEAALRWESLRPDVLVVDQRLPGTSGLDLAVRILQEDPGACILLFSASLDSAIAGRAAEVGIRSCVSKDRIRELPVLVREHGPRRRGLVPTAPADASTRRPFPPPSR